jgi:hypothetical protein
MKNSNKCLITSLKIKRLYAQWTPQYKSRFLLNFKWKNGFFYALY